MNQRKLFGALSIVLLAILFIAVGCGDGKRTSRANVNKRVKHGKVGAQGPGQQVQVPPQKKAESLAKEQATAEFQQTINGTQIANFPDGQFALVEVVTSVNFQNPPQDAVYTRRTDASTRSSSQFGGGILKDNPDSQGRQFLIPEKFTVNNGAPVQPETTGFRTRFETDSSDLKNGIKMSLIDQLGVAAEPSQIVLLNLLNSTPTTNKNGLNRVGKTADGKELVTWIIKPSEDKISIQISISEGAQAGQQNNLSKKAAIAFARHMVFVYSFKAKVAAEPTPPPTAE